MLQEFEAFYISKLCEDSPKPDEVEPAMGEGCSEEDAQQDDELGEGSLVALGPLDNMLFQEEPLSAVLPYFEVAVLQKHQENQQHDRITAGLRSADTGEVLFACQSNTQKYFATDSNGRLIWHAKKDLLSAKTLEFGGRSVTGFGVCYDQFGEPTGEITIFKAYLNTSSPGSGEEYSHLKTVKICIPKGSRLLPFIAFTEKYFNETPKAMSVAASRVPNAGGINALLEHHPQLLQAPIAQMRAFATVAAAVDESKPLPLAFRLIEHVPAAVETKVRTTRGGAALAGKCVIEEFSGGTFAIRMSCAAACVASIILKGVDDSDLTIDIGPKRRVCLATGSGEECALLAEGILPASPAAFQSISVSQLTTMLQTAARHSGKHQQAPELNEDLFEWLHNNYGEGSADHEYEGFHVMDIILAKLEAMLMLPLSAFGIKLIQSEKAASIPKGKGAPPPRGGKGSTGGKSGPPPRGGVSRSASDGAAPEGDVSSLESETKKKKSGKSWGNRLFGWVKKVADGTASSGSLWQPDGMFPLAGLTLRSLAEDLHSKLNSPDAANAVQELLWVRLSGSTLEVGTGQMLYGSNGSEWSVSPASVIPVYCAQVGVQSCCLSAQGLENVRVGSVRLNSTEDCDWELSARRTPSLVREDIIVSPVLAMYRDGQCPSVLPAFAAEDRTVLPDEWSPSLDCALAQFCSMSGGSLGSLESLEERAREVQHATLFTPLLQLCNGGFSTSLQTRAKAMNEISQMTIEVMKQLDLSDHSNQLVQAFLALSAMVFESHKAPAIQTALAKFSKPRVGDAPNVSLNRWSAADGDDPTGDGSIFGQVTVSNAPRARFWG